MASVPTSPPARKKHHTYTEGRPPWYDSRSGTIHQPLVIGVAGGTASGKSTVCRRIIKELRIPWVVHLSMDSFYKDLTPEQKANAANYNFDHPNAFDVDLMVKTLRDLREGKSVQVPIYDFCTHSRVKDNFVRMYGADVIVFEGILVLYFPELLPLIDIKIFVDEDADIRLARRLRRDIAERGRDVQGVLKQYDLFVKPAFDEYIFPSKKDADIIVPRAAVNAVAINLIVEHIRTTLRARGATFAPDLMPEAFDPRTVPTLHLMEQHNQIRGLHTIIRNQATSRSDFVFYTNRLTRLLIEEALGLLPTRSKDITTPTGHIYAGRSTAASVCGVSVMRAGETMETALRDVVKGVPILKVLIQSTNPNKLEKSPRLFYVNILPDMEKRHVLLLDPMLATGATVKMAIRVLREHGVLEENIIYCSLVAAPQGIYAVHYAYPKVSIITSQIDEKLNERGYILPGLGNFGDRYFGTD